MRGLSQHRVRGETPHPNPLPASGAREAPELNSSMLFTEPLIPATLARRYKRFLADVVLTSGEAITAHVANPGAMIGLAAPGSRVWLSKSANAKRKLPYSWELVEVDLGTGPELIGINTAHPNLLVAEAIAVPELVGYTATRREVNY